MARMPQARWLGERSPRNDMSRYDAVCVHTIVGFAPAHAAHFSVHHDGTIDQSRDTRYRSAANLNGNHRIISIENEDHGSGFPSWNTRDGHAVPGLTVRQIEANAQILAWAHKTHGIPLQLCPNSRPTSRGLAYHRQGIDGNFSGYKYGGRVSGGEVWSSSRGKVCPGDRRIDQLPAILARAKQIVTGTPQPPKDDHMSAADVEALKKYIDERTLTSEGVKSGVLGAVIDMGNGADSRARTARDKLQDVMRVEILANLIRASSGGDPAAQAAALAALLLPEIREEVRAELADFDGVDEDAVAEKVVSRVGLKLTTPDA